MLQWAGTIRAAPWDIARLCRAAPSVPVRCYKEADVIKKILQFLVLKRLWDRRRGRR